MRTKKKEKKELKMEMLKYVSGGSDKEIAELKAVILANPDLESAWKTAVECFDDGQEKYRIYSVLEDVLDEAGSNIYTGDKANTYVSYNFIPTLMNRFLRCSETTINN